MEEKLDLALAQLSELRARCDKLEQMALCSLGQTSVTQRLAMDLWCAVLEKPREAVEAFREFITYDLIAVHFTTTACPEKGKPYREWAQQAFDRARAHGLVSGERIPLQVRHLYSVPERPEPAGADD